MSLETEAKYFRGNVVRGSKAKVEREGGYASAGIIRSVAMITEGEALGHDVWIDSEFNQQVADAINSADRGIKSRFTHPTLSGDGFGKFLGRAMDARVEGDKVVADVHFSKAAHNTPDGNLAEYVMDLAENDSDAFGMSIAFGPEWDEMESFAAAWSDKNGDFDSPDERNEKNLLHVRLGELRAVDAVDEPAANPDGLFHREENAAVEADAVLSYALGLSDDKPNTKQFSVDADRVKGFVGRFLDVNNLVLGYKEPGDMGIIKLAESALIEDPQIEEEATPAATEAKPETDNAEDSVTAVGEAEAAEETEPEAVTMSEGERFLKTFGDRGGVWFAQGKSFEEAQAIYLAELKEENERLKTKLQAASVGGEAEPVEFSEAKPVVQKQKVLRIAGKK